MVRRASPWLLLLTLASLACASAPSSAGRSPAPTSPAPTTPPPTMAAPAPAVDPVEARAAELVKLATAAEPDVTPRLKSLAAKAKGEMVKLEHRLKTAESTTRKLRLELKRKPDLELSTYMLGDSLRYTMVVADAPSGHHVQAVHQTLAALEAEGHAVVKVKNYWPKGDNYSGINCVLKTPGGLLWELQFHTPASLQVQADTRPQYEELRLRATPLERKRELFDQMTEAWDVVPLPEGILEPAALHSTEQIRNRARP